MQAPPVPANSPTPGGPALQDNLSLEAWLPLHLNKYVTLNVGGKKYGTTIKTLAKTALESPLREALAFFGRGGHTFHIDRDAELFAHILNILREEAYVGTVKRLPLATKRMLLIEAEYFKLKSLLKELLALRELPPSLTVCVGTSIECSALPNSLIEEIRTRSSEFTSNSYSEMIDITTGALSVYGYKLQGFVYNEEIRRFFCIYIL